MLQNRRPQQHMNYMPAHQRSDECDGPVGGVRRRQADQLHGTERHVSGSWAAGPLVEGVEATAYIYIAFVAVLSVAESRHHARHERTPC